MAKEHIGITDLSALTQWVNTVTKGVYSVEFVDGAETAAISGNKMILPKPNTGMSLRDMIRLRGFALHETSHPLYQKEAFDILKEARMNPDSPLGAIYNMCLDVHAETSRADEYPGDRKALSEFGAVLGRDITDSIVDKVPGVDPESDSGKTLAMMHATLEAESQWNMGLRSGTADLLAAMPEGVKSKSEELRDKFDLMHRLTDPTESARSLWTLSGEIFEFLYGRPPETEQNQTGEGEGSGEKGGGEGEEKGESTGESGTNSDGDSECDPHAEGAKGGDPKKGNLTVRQMVWSSHYEGGVKGDYGHGKSMKFDEYEEYAMYTPYPQPDFKVIDYDTVKAKEHGCRELPAAEAVSQNAPGFVSELRRLIQVKAEAHYSQGYRSGKLAPSRLWRVGAPPIDEGRWNASVFKRKTETSDVMNTCVSLLVDASGSMGGAKYENAYRAAAILNDTLSRVLHIPVEINTFTSYGDQPVMGLIKKFDKQVAPQELRTRFSDFVNHMSGNNDADSISWVYDRLHHRREKRKILVVFSDGSPADGLGDPHYALRTVVGEIEKAGIVDIYGIGICTTSVQRFYTKHDVIQTADEVQRALIKVLRTALV